MTFQEIQNLMWAAKLIELEARTPIIEHLTGITASRIRRLFYDIKRTGPVPGQMPYSTTWFEKRAERMVHCAVYLRSHAAESANAGEPAAAVFLRGYARYEKTVELLPEPWKEQKINVNYAFLATRLSRMGELTRRTCAGCRCRFVEVRSALAKTCQICRNRVSDMPVEERERLLGDDDVESDDVKKRSN